jgi:hypothetical protein
MHEPNINHKQLAIAYFNSTWKLIELPDRTPDQDHAMLTLAFASRQHWIEAGSGIKNRLIADWQVSHVASLIGMPDVSLSFARTAVELSETVDDIPIWCKASAHEGLARASAVSGDLEGYRREVEIASRLLEQEEDAEDREHIQHQLDSIPVPNHLP